MNFTLFRNVSLSALSLTMLLSLSGCFEDKPTEQVSAPAAATEPVAAPTPAPVAAPAPKPVAKPAAKPVPAAEAKPAPCNECGVVVSINMIEQKGQGSGAGAILGGITGGVLGHQVGDGTGKDIATAVGVVGGAVAGHKIEQNIKKTMVYDVAVKMDVSGETRILRHAADPKVAAGDKVKVVNDQVLK